MQGMANRPPMGDSGEQMPMEDNQQANAQQQQITQIQNRVKSLPIQEKKVLSVFDFDDTIAKSDAWVYVMQHGIGSSKSFWFWNQSIYRCIGIWN